MSQTAVVCASAGQYRLATDVRIASPPAPGTVLCAVRAVALNPADWKMADFAARDTASDLVVGGHEFAGEVVEVAPDVTSVRPGDRVLAPTPGLNRCSLAAGAFCQYTAVAADMLCRIPDGVSYEDAAGLSVVTCTAGLALKALGIALPDGSTDADGKNGGPYVLVSGGASATGTVAIQLLRAAGCRPIATCSPQNSAMLRALGAVETFDYHAPSCGMDIRNYTDNALALVLDCVTQPESMALAYEALGSAVADGTNGPDGPNGPNGPKRYIALDPPFTRIQYTRRDVHADWVMGLSLFGESVQLAGVYGRPARPQDRRFTAQLFGLVEHMLAAGTLKPHPVEHRTGGLAAVTAGIEDLRMGRVHARKLVYSI